MSAYNIREYVLRTLEGARDTLVWLSLDEILARVPWFPPDPKLLEEALALLNNTEVKIDALTREQVYRIIVVRYLEDLEFERVIDRVERLGEIRFKMRPSKG